MVRKASRDDLEGSWEWLKFAAALPSRPYAFTAQTNPLAVMTGRAILTGITFNNTATTAGRVDILDGQDGNGTLAFRVPAAATALGGLPAPGRGILLEIGCFLNINAATLTGAVTLIPLWHYETTPPGE